MSEILRSSAIATAWPWRRIAHGAAAYTIVLFAVFIVASIVISVTQSLVAAQTELADRAQKTATLETALQANQTTLLNNLQSIGEEGTYGAADLTPQRSLARLDADANALVTALEAEGFALTARSAPKESRITQTLSHHEISLAFTGDAHAAVALMGSPLSVGARIASMTIDVSAAPSGVTTLVLKTDLMRISAATPAADIDDGGAGE